MFIFGMFSGCVIMFIFEFILYKIAKNKMKKNKLDNIKAYINKTM